MAGTLRIGLGEGELDRYYTPELFWTTAERIPDVRLRLYAGKGHARIATLRQQAASARSSSS